MSAPRPDRDRRPSAGTVAGATDVDGAPADRDVDGANPAHRRPPATLLRRATALGLDLAVVFFVQLALVVVQILWFMDPLSSRIQPDPWGRSFVATIVFIVLYGCAEIVFVARLGQTPARDLLHVRVVAHGTDAPPSPWRVARGWVPVGLACLVRPVWLAVAVIAAISLVTAGSRRRSLLDLLAGTEVVAYDADKEEGTDDVDDDEDDDPGAVAAAVRSRYGPRSYLDAITERGTRRTSSPR